MKYFGQFDSVAFDDPGKSVERVERLTEVRMCDVVIEATEDWVLLFSPGFVFLFANDGKEMMDHLARVLEDAQLANSLADTGLRTIRNVTVAVIEWINC